MSTVTHERVLSSVVITKDHRVIAEYHDLFSLDGVVVAESSEEVRLNRNPATFDLRDGKIVAYGTFTTGSSMTWEVGGQSYTLSVPQDTLHTDIGELMAAEVGEAHMMILESEDVNGTDWQSVISFEDPDEDAVEGASASITVEVTNASITVAPFTSLPDDIVAIISGVTS